MTPPAAPPPGFGPPPQPYAPQPQGPPQQPYAYPQAAQPPQPYGYPGVGAGAPVAEGPEFLAVDCHNSVVVDVSGVAFEDHGISVDFPWPEIRSVHYKASPNGKALMVAVIHLDGRFYECTVEAKPRERLHQWFGQLAQVLGYYRPMG
ncbi:hypothetical protein [Streptomyces capitiformicae]|uniref:Uncharacterized protein n=1 Tax=Streptomyces capitiformicae TaxID=2014920 RepID=A0A918Z476_9ACTN|nr:hypothetical protein [Streptomyces capitiformicae]GHE33491.1 hypothetical protein GCM10017771_50670 [Streptomyces capitiformicae]